MGSNNPLSNEIRDLAIEWRKIKGSDAAMKGDSTDGLRALDRETLIAYAGRAFETLDEIERSKIGYSIAMVEQHIERPADDVCAWVIASADKDGGFNKFVKTLSAPTLRRIPMMVFSTWEAAKSHLDDMHSKQSFSAGQPHDSGMKIFPVVLSAGREPRTTVPRE